MNITGLGTTLTAQPATVALSNKHFQTFLSTCRLIAIIAMSTAAAFALFYLIAAIWMQHEIATHVGAATRLAGLDASMRSLIRWTATASLLPLALRTIAASALRAVWPFGLKTGILRSNLALLAAGAAIYLSPTAIKFARQVDDSGLPNRVVEVEPSGADWFDYATKNPKLWYATESDGSWKFYNRPGYRPSDGQLLNPVTSELRKSWEQEQTRRQQEDGRRKTAALEAEGSARAHPEGQVTLKGERQIATDSVHIPQADAKNVRIASPVPTSGYVPGGDGGNAVHNKLPSPVRHPLLAPVAYTRSCPYAMPPYVGSRLVVRSPRLYYIRARSLPPPPPPAFIRFRKVVFIQRKAPPPRITYRCVPHRRIR